MFFSAVPGGGGGGVGGIRELNTFMVLFRFFSAQSGGAESGSSVPLRFYSWFLVPDLGGVTVLFRFFSDGSC